MWSTLLAACPHPAPVAPTASPPPTEASPAAEGPEPTASEASLRETMDLLEGYTFPPAHRPRVLVLGKGLMQTMPCTSSGGRWLRSLQPPMVPRDAPVPDWALVMWEGTTPDEATPFVAACVRTVSAGCYTSMAGAPPGEGERALWVAGPDATWFADRATAEQAAAAMPDCPAP
ncbi:MAG: hypothetical protein ABMA64_24475 [Myxococcota bacterium]